MSFLFDVCITISNLALNLQTLKYQMGLQCWQQKSKRMSLKTKTKLIVMNEKLDEGTTLSAQPVKAELHVTT